MKKKTVWVLYVFSTSVCVSFRIEQGLDLGPVGEVSRSSKLDKDMRMIEHEHTDCTTTINYVNPEDCHASEKDAMKALIKILQRKVRGK